MRTVKLVVIGNSGVGKTSLRGQYVSGHFSTGYRATIGADFISKTLPHPSNPDESVTLQIWDTAGQERFSSLSAAFFRGADAALLMYDVNQPATLHALARWWAEFRARAPLADDDVADYPLVVVGNKTDLVRGAADAAVSEAAARRFLAELVPLPASRADSPVTPEDEDDAVDDVDPGADGAGWTPRVASGSDDEAADPRAIVLVDETGEPAARALANDSAAEPDALALALPPRTAPLDLAAQHHRHRRASKSRSRSSQLRAGGGTLSSTATGWTAFHTPASSFGDGYVSARSTPPPPSPALRPRALSTSTASTSSAPTITPARYAAARPPRGPRLFFASAKTGASVPDVFAYVAARVVMRWEWEEARGDVRARASTVQLGDAASTNTAEARRRAWQACCTS
ncbi:P-loop containing nucleoside triphosphate hydrolase protein [Gloeopeniophorella convolvens]|nr:P-loop containing nucleoside triphosphate hydrolase protein [Gloeopeniophorella convolvens]